MMEQNKLYIQSGWSFNEYSKLKAEHVCVFLIDGLLISLYIRKLIFKVDASMSAF